MPKEPKENLEKLEEEQIVEESIDTAQEPEPSVEPEVQLEETVQIDEVPVEEDYTPSNEQSNDADDETVTVKPVQFASFENLTPSQGEINKNLEILMDIKLQLTVELGRTELPIKKVLELTRGSIIELEKVAGEPVELYANGKLVAHGEVVVIEDNFGLRITSITEPEDRLKGI